MDIGIAETEIDSWSTETRGLEPAAGVALDPLVEELSFVGVELVGADPDAIATRTDLVEAAASFSRLLEQAWIPGRSVAIGEIASTQAHRPQLQVRMLCGVAGPRGTTAADARSFGSAALRSLRRWPSPYRVTVANPSDVLDVDAQEAWLIGQRTASAASDTLEAAAVSRWDRPADAWLDVAHAVLDNPGTRLRTTLLATELGIDDVAWLRRELAKADAVAEDARDHDPDLHHRAVRLRATLVDMLESFRTPVFCGEVAVLSPGPVSEFLLRELASAITCEFDVIRSGETPTVAARTRWVGGYALEPAPEGQHQALRTGVPLRGGLRSRRLVDLLSLTEAACAFQWPIPAGSGVPTIANSVTSLLPAPAGLAKSGARIGRDSVGHQVLLGLEDRLSHVHVIGATGTGKTTVHDHLISGDVQAGRAFVVIDPHGPLAERSMRKLEAADQAMAIFDPDNPATERIALLPRPGHDEAHDEALDRAISRLIDAVTSHLPADYSGPRFRQLARMALTVVAHAGGGLADVGPLLYERETAHALLKRAAGAGRAVPPAVVALVSSFHEASNNDRASAAQWVAAKFDELASSALLPCMLAPPGEGMDVAEILAAGIPIVANLGGTETLETRLFGHLLVGQVLDAAFARPPEGRTLLPVFIDEVQSFYVANMERALNEGRKYGVSLTLGHQHTGQLPDRARHAVMGGCALRVAFRLDEEDANRIGSSMGVRPRDLMGQPNLQAVIHRSDLGAERPAFTCILDPYEALS